MALILITIIGFCGCGVKGKPQPPLTPPVIGHGKQNYPKSSKQIQIQNKKKPTTSEDDWSETEGFEAEKE